MNNIKEHLALLTVSIIYGLNFLIAKEVMPQYILPSGFILLRVIVATVFFFALACFVVNEKIAKKDWPRLIACGVFGVALNQLFFFAGLNYTTPINASLIMITTPISVLILAYFINKDKITWQKAVGIFLGATGAILIIISNKTFKLQNNGLLGDVMVLFNALFYAAYLVMVKPLMRQYHPLTVIKWVFLFGLFPVVFVGYHELQLVQWHTFSMLTWYYVAFVLIFTTILAYLLNIYAMKKVSPALVGIYIYVQPIVATAFAISLQKDHLTFLKIIAAAFIFMGVYLSSTEERKRKSE